MSNGPPLSRVLEQVDQDEKESDLKMQRILADIA